MINSYYQYKCGLLFHSEGKKDYSGIQKISRGHFLVLLCFMIKLNGKFQFPNSGRTSNDPEDLEMKVWVTSLGKKP
jgi:hypothetical protein